MQFKKVFIAAAIAAVLNGCDAQAPSTNSSSSNLSSSSSSSSSSASSSASSASSSSSSGDGGSESALVIEENEAGVCRVDGDPSEAKNPGFAGAGYANADNRVGAGIVWAVSVATSSVYQVFFRFANGGTLARDASLLINNGANGDYAVSFAPTGSWAAWQVVSLSVDLVQGNNLLELKSLGADGLANIDSLSVGGPQPQPGNCSEQNASSSSSSSSSSSNSSSGIGSAPLLSQVGNPAKNRYEKAKNAWAADKASIVLSHQFANGGWPKNQAYDSPGSGGSGDGQATFDNNATTTETIYLANLYNSDPQSRYRDAVRKALDYTLSAQYPSGGWPQFYPLKGGYADHVTFNDNAMSSILTMLHNVAEGNAPFNNDSVTSTQKTQARAAVAKGVEYILKSQWLQNGTLTAWCAQHGATDYLPKAARAYELESLSGSESVEIIGFLMTQPQTPQIETAVKAALAWFRSPNTYLADHMYDKTAEQKIVAKAGSKMWYRFYKLDTNRGFFSDRDGGTYYDIMEISAERRNGYSWGGAYGDRIIAYANTVGY